MKNRKKQTRHALVFIELAFCCDHVLGLPFFVSTQIYICSVLYADVYEERTIFLFIFLFSPINRRPGNRVISCLFLSTLTRFFSISVFTSRFLPSCSAIRIQGLSYVTYSRFHREAKWQVRAFCLIATESIDPEAGNKSTSPYYLIDFHYCSLINTIDRTQRLHHLSTLLFVLFYFIKFRLDVLLGT